MKRKDSIMTERVAEEIYKFGLNNTEMARKLGCHRNAVVDWLTGRSIPSAFHLNSMHLAGMDVIYILTGERRA